MGGILEHAIALQPPGQHRTFPPVTQCFYVCVDKEPKQGTVLILREMLMYSFRTFAAFTIIALLVSTAQSQTDEQPVTPDKADEFFSASNWSDAAAAYTWLVQSDPKDGRSWLRLGFSLQNLGRYKEAITAYEEAEDLKFAPQATRYNLACSYARLNDPDRAIGWLDLAVEAGYSNMHSLKNDSDLVSIRSDERFAAILERADKLSRPCENDPAFGVLDFWLGEWDVLDKDSNIVASNIIERILDGCAVTEHWIGKDGFEGRSLFYYNNISARWTQVWITGLAASPGGLKEKYLVALYDDGAVRFQGEYPSVTGALILDRTTLTPLADGRVRQIIERSADGGNSWVVGFDAYYVRKR